MAQHEDKEKEILQMLKEINGVEGKKPTQPTGDQYVESRGGQVRHEVRWCKCQRRRGDDPGLSGQ